MRQLVRGRRNTVTRVVLGAFAPCEWAVGPRWAEFDSGEELLARIEALDGAVRELELSSAKAFISPTSWGPEGVEDKLMLRGDELVVSNGAFSITTTAHSEDFPCETYWCGIQSFRDALHACHGDVVFLGDDVADLARAYRDGGEVLDRRGPAPGM